MLTRVTEEDWATVLEVFRACRSRRGAKGRNDRIFLEAVHYFAVHNITWRALPAACGNRNSVWKRFWRLSQAGVFEAVFDALAAMSQTAHLVQMFDSTIVRAHVSAAGAKGEQDGQALGRSRGGFSTKIHLKADLDGRPLAFHLTEGQAGDSPQFEILLDLGPDDHAICGRRLGELVDLVAKGGDGFARLARGVAQLLVRRHRLGQLALRLEQSFLERALPLRGVCEAPAQLVDLLLENGDLGLQHLIGCVRILCHDFEPTRMTYP